MEAEARKMNEAATSRTSPNPRVIPAAIITSFPQHTHVIHTPIITSFPRRRESGCAVLWRPLMCARLRRLPRRPGAEERRACSDEEATSKEEQEQQPA